MTELLTYGPSDYGHLDESDTCAVEKQSIYGCGSYSLSYQKIFKATLVGVVLSSATCSPGGTFHGLRRSYTSNTISSDKIEIGEAKVISTVPALNQQVDLIIDALSLTMSQAARVFCVSRPTVYSWKSEVDIANVCEKNKERLLKIYELAKFWSGLDSGPLGDRVLIPFEDDHKCLIDYLTTPNIDIQTVDKVKERLAFLASHDAQSRLVRLGTDHWKEAFRKKGFEESSSEERDVNFEDNLRRIRYED